MDIKVLNWAITLYNNNSININHGVCLCVQSSARVRACVRARVGEWVSVWKCVCQCVCECVSECVRVWVYVSVCVWMCEREQQCVRACDWTCESAWLNVWEFVSECVSECVVLRCEESVQRDCWCGTKYTNTNILQKLYTGANWNSFWIKVGSM